MVDFDPSFVSQIGRFEFRLRLVILVGLLEVGFLLKVPNSSINKMLKRKQSFELNIKVAKLNDFRTFKL